MKKIFLFAISPLVLIAVFCTLFVAGTALFAVSFPMTYNELMVTPPWIALMGTVSLVSAILVFVEYMNFVDEHY